MNCIKDIYWENRETKNWFHISKFHTCTNVTKDVTKHFSVTIDCVRFLIRRFPLDAYSMLQTKIKRKWSTKEITRKGFECNKSSKAMGCQWVWVFNCFFLNSSKTSNTNKELFLFLSYISLCADGFRLKKFQPFGGK